MKRAELNGILLAGAISMVAYADGFLALLHGLTEAGEFNPAIAVVVAAAAGTAFVFRKRMPIWLPGVLAAFAVLMVALAAIDDQGAAQKLARDYLYMFLLVVTFSAVRERIDNGRIDSRSFAAWLALLIIVIFPTLGAVTGMVGYEGRFAGFSLSPPIFANGVMLAYLVARNNHLRLRWIVPLFVASVLCIVLSGTRSALMTLVLYEMLLLGTAAGIARNRSAYYALILLGSAIVALVAWDLRDAMTTGGTHSRVFAQSDSDGGSLNTRVGWYLELWMRLASNNYFGGFGAGSAERATGYITHFDVLRYWYDYSILFVGLFSFVLVRGFLSGSAVRNAQARGYRRLVVPFFMANVLLMSLHNIFQAPGTLLLFAVYLNFARLQPEAIS
ncbi:hypothetical protein [Burkholderia sp. AW49-1]